jgi:predicted enzyme related to lactoylglutathione lyase
MLLRATGGDPPDDTRFLDEWAWAELWTNDTAAAAEFYSALAGYNAMRLPDANGGERVVLGTNGQARATIVALPWEDVDPSWIPYIPVASVPDTMGRIVDAGGAVLEKAGAGESATVAIVMGPTGGVFAIQQVGSQQ